MSPMSVSKGENSRKVEMRGEVMSERDDEKRELLK